MAIRYVLGARRSLGTLDLSSLLAWTGPAARRLPFSALLLGRFSLQGDLKS